MRSSGSITPMRAGICPARSRSRASLSFNPTARERGLLLTGERAAAGLLRDIKVTDVHRTSSIPEQSGELSRQRTLKSSAERASMIGMRRLLLLALVACSSAKPVPPRGTAAERPDAFVSLTEVEPTILVELRYLGTHNFMGRPVLGYKAEKCLLTRPAALALKSVQEDLRPFGLGLKAYDCYRPQRAVDTFVAWAKDFADTKMQA